MNSFNKFEINGQEVLFDVSTDLNIEIQHNPVTVNPLQTYTDYGLTGDGWVQPFSLNAKITLGVFELERNVSYLFVRTDDNPITIGFSDTLYSVEQQPMLTNYITSNTNVYEFNNTNGYKYLYTNIGRDSTPVYRAYGYYNVQKSNDDILDKLSLEQKFEKTFSDIIQGTVNINSKVPNFFQESATRLRTNGMIPIYSGMNVSITLAANANNCFVILFDKNSKYIKESGWITSDYTLNITTDGYIIIMFRKSNDDEIIPSEYDANIVFKSKTATSLHSLHFGTDNSMSISSNEDLNNYTSPGSYYAETIHIVLTLSNAPSDRAGRLFVYNLIRDSSVIYQQYIDVLGRIYTREKLAAGWTSWVKVLTIADDVSSFSFGRRNAIASSAQFTDIKWTPIRPIPVTNDNGYIPAGTQVTGLPYSSTRSVCKYIGQHLTLYTFMSALQNPHSVLYTRRIKYGSLGKTYYGVTCFTLTSYAQGSKLGMFDNEIIWMTNGIAEEISPYEIQPGDALQLIYDRETFGNPYEGGEFYQHCILIHNIQKDRQGRITTVTLAEAAPPYCRLHTHTFSNFISNYINGTYKYKVYRKTKRTDFGYYIQSEFVKGYPDENLPTVTYPDIMPEYGDRACIEAGTDVVVNVINTGIYNAINIYKNNVLIETKTTIADFTINNIEYGTYKFEITDGTNSSESTLIVADINGTYDSETKRITFSSANATPVFAASYITGTSLKGVQNKVKYFTEDEIKQGYADMNGIVGEYYNAVQIGYLTEYGVAMWWSSPLDDEWEYWSAPES